MKFQVFAKSHKFGIFTLFQIFLYVLWKVPSDLWIMYKYVYCLTFGVSSSVLCWFPPEFHCGQRTYFVWFQVLKSVMADFNWKYGQLRISQTCEVTMHFLLEIF